MEDDDPDRVSRIEAITGILAALINLGIGFAIGAWATTNWGHTYGAVVYGISATLISSLFVMLNVVIGDRWKDKPRGDAGLSFLRSLASSGWYVLSLAVVLAFAYILAYSQFLRQLNYLFGGFAVPASSTGYWSWFLYGLSWVVDNLSLSAFGIMGWNISPIQATAIWARLLVLAFNLTLGLLVLTTLLRLYRQYVRRQIRHRSTN